MTTVDLNGVTFEPTVTGDGIVLVDLWAEWCGPCRIFGPVFEAASEAHPDIVFAKVDTEAEQRLAGKIDPFDSYADGLPRWRARVPAGGCPPGARPRSAGRCDPRPGHGGSPSQGRGGAGRRVYGGAPMSASRPRPGDAGIDRASEVRLDSEDIAALVRRLKRAEGQIAGVVRMLEDGRDCREVVMQVAAVSRALDRAGFAIIASGLRRCLANPNEQGAVDTAELERLFLSLA